MEKNCDIYSCFRIYVCVYINFKLPYILYDCIEPYQDDCTNCKFSFNEGIFSASDL